MAELRQAEIQCARATVIEPRGLVQIDQRSS